jgi:hypothetical protein
MTNDNKQFHFSQSSLSKLITVDNRLQLLAKEVLKISPIDFAITSGLRTKEEQNKLYKEGKSKCDGIKNMSKHQEGKAIDIMPIKEGYGQIEQQKVDNGYLMAYSQKDIYILVGLFLGVANKLDIKIRTGALWDKDSVWNNGFVDGYHVEIED